MHWSDAFNLFAEDTKYWDREVRRPALKCVASGCRGSPQEPDDDEGVHGLKQKLNMVDPKDGGDDNREEEGSSRQRRRRRGQT